MHLKKSLITSSLAVLMLTGCYQQPGLIADNNYDRTKSGALIGALTGALIGYNTKGHHKGERALIGGLLGGAAGSAIGYSLDKQANEIADALGTGVNNDPLAALDPNRSIIVSKHPNYVKIMFRDRMMFATNASTLQANARNKVQKIRQLLTRYPQTVVEVAGFTDNSGSYDYNLQLSKRRADSVANILTVNQRPITRGCSYQKALVPNNTESNKALNRRVEIYLYPNQNSLTDPCR